MNIFLTGANSVICQELEKLLVPDCTLHKFDSKKLDFNHLDNIDQLHYTILQCDRFVLLHSCLSTHNYIHMTEEEILKVMKVNLLSTVKIIELALENPQARIAVIGSESGLKGSFDVAYGLSKAALHKYVEEKRIKYPGQQLVCVAPSLMEDSNYTKSRKDVENVIKAIKSNPKGRGLLAKEVAKLIHFLLFVDEGYITNTVIHMNGGKYARA